MAFIITQSTKYAVNEPRLQLGNESVVMPVNFGPTNQWNGFRIGIRYVLGYTNYASEIEWLMGAFKNINKPFRSNNCEEWLGCSVLAHSGGVGLGIGQMSYAPGVVPYYTSTIGRSWSKVGSTLGPATGGYTGSSGYVLSGYPTSQAGQIFYDFLRTAQTATTSTWTIYWTGNNTAPSAANGSTTRADFMKNMEMAWQSSPTYVAGVVTGGVTWTGHVHPGPGEFDAVELSWNHYIPTLDILDFAVIRIA